MTYFRQLINKIKTSKLILLGRELFTLGGNSKYAPASLTFYLIISLVPVISLIFIFLSVLGYDINDFIYYLKEHFKLSEELNDFLSEYFLNIHIESKLVLNISIIILIYISSKGINFFIFAYSKISRKEMKFTRFFKQKIWSVLLSLILDVFLSFLLIFLVFFNNFLFKSNTRIPTIFTPIFLLLIVFIFLTFLYSISSSEKVKFKDIYLGALISSFSICIGMTLYILFIENFSNPSSYYGPLTSFILLLLIIYYSSYITLLGVEINYLYKRKKNLHNEDSLISL